MLSSHLHSSLCYTPIAIHLNVDESSGI
jgi:hypothetical protein